MHCDHCNVRWPREHVPSQCCMDSAPIYVVYTYAMVNLWMVFRSCEWEEKNGTLKFCCYAASSVGYIAADGVPWWCWSSSRFRPFNHKGATSGDRHLCSRAAPPKAQLHSLLG